LVERGLHDELKGTAYAIVDGVDGRTHHLVFSDPEVRADAKPGAIVETRAYDDTGGSERLSLAPDRISFSQMDSALSSGGFGAEVGAAMDRRIDHLVDQDLARQQDQRLVFARDLLDTLRRRELYEATANLTANTGLAHRRGPKPTLSAGPVSFQCRRSASRNERVHCAGVSDVAGSLTFLSARRRRFPPAAKRRIRGFAGCRWRFRL
jgi:hypothetical protein